MNLYFDEAGYTGSNLIDKACPYYVLASVCYTDDELTRIKSDLRLSSSVNELHFVDLRNSISGRNTIVNLLNHPLVNEQHVKYAYTERRYCIYAQIVNILIETFVHDCLHEDLYKGHAALVMANCFYTFAINHRNQPFIESFEDTFVEMIRTQGSESIDEFFGLVSALRQDPDTNSQMNELLLLVEASRVVLEDALSDDKFYLDTTLTMFNTLVQSWRIQESSNFNVLFDNSKPMAQYRTLVEALSKIEDTTIVGYGSKKETFPLPINSFKLVDSKSYFGVQIADVIASTLAFNVNYGEGGKFYRFKERLQTLPFLKMQGFNLGASTSEYLEKMMNDPADDDINPIDYLCEQIGDIEK